MSKRTLSYVWIVICTGAILTLVAPFRYYLCKLGFYVNQIEEANLILKEENQEFLELLETMSAVIDVYDVYTYGQSAQVAEYAAAIAEKMNLSPEEQAVVARAALVYDIGKVGISDSTSAELGILTDEEHNGMERYPVIGAQMVAQKGLQELVPLVRHQHERWDGSGYPDGLKGEEIPVGARILALADTLDAMFSDHPYGSTRSFREAMAEVARSSGKQFDPDVVAAFLAVAKEKAGNFFVDSAATVDRSIYK
ncbi:MAG: HD domain-containing protein [Anaerolineales bacterium]|nr:HD domain-containing protein [Anaerolineales bacterium]